MTNRKGSTKSGRYPRTVPERRTVVRKRRKPSVRATVAARRARLAVYTAGTLIVLACIAHAASGFVRDMPYFRIEKLQISGVSARIESEVKGLLDKATTGKGNLLNLDISEIGKAIRSHPRIRDLKLQKIYPDTLVIEASERQPEAVVSADGFYLVDREGMVMEKVKPGDLREYDLVYLTGLSPDEIRVGEKIYQPSLYRALDTIRVLRQRAPELYGKFSEIHIERDPITHIDNLTAHLAGGMEVRFGDSNPIERLPMLEFFVVTLREQKQDPFAMLYLDLRFQDQIVFMEKERALAMARGQHEALQAPQKKVDELLKPARSGSSSASPKASQSSPPSGDRPRPSAGSRPSRTDAAGRTVTAPPAQSAPATQAPAAPEARRGLSRLKFWERDRTAAPRQQQPAAPRGFPNPFGTR